MCRLSVGLRRKGRVNSVSINAIREIARCDYKQVFLKQV